MNLALAPMLNRPQPRLTVSAAFSLALHAFILFGIGLTLPDWRNNLIHSQPLEVTLVNSKSNTRPNNATAYAQSNLDGGGNVEDDRHARTPFPVIGDDRRFQLEQATRRLRQLEEENQRLLTQTKAQYSVAQNKIQAQRKSSPGTDGYDLVQRSLEIARLEAQISKRMDVYEKMPKRRFIGARTQEYRFAQYVEDWRTKVERIGNLNYPEAARSQKIFGKLTMTVSIRADGSIESIEINRSSGQRILDAAAMRIVKLSSPFSPFPPDIRKDTDIISITRTWIFTSTDKLETDSN